MRCLPLATGVMAAWLAGPPLPAAEWEAVISGRVLDAGTQQEIPCTVTMRTSGVVLGADNPSFRDGFRSPGRFETAVPPGEIGITVRRGFDYAGETRKVHLRPGERVHLTFKLERRTPLRREGWYCGENHTHMVHDDPRIPVTFDYAALAARAEALDYMAFAHYWGISGFNPARLDREFRRVSRPDCLLTWNLEMPKNYWRGDVSKCVGHGWTIGMRGYTADNRDAIQELMAMNAWDYESEKTPTPNFDSHALIHALEGAAFYTHPANNTLFAAELPFDTVAGPTYDGIDVLTGGANPRAQQLWFMLLNHGYRMPGTASTDAAFNNPGGAVPGRARVYTRLEGELTLAAVAKAMKAGRNFATNGPLLVFEIGKYQIGDVIRVNRPVNLKARVRAWASGVPGQHLKTVEIIRNGEVVKTFAVEGGAAEYSSEFEVSEGRTAWYLARCAGSGAGQVALTNPIYFESDDYRPPKPALALVSATVKDSATGQPLDGTAEIVAMVGRTPVTRSVHKFQNGRFTLEAPATARIRVRAAGHGELIKSIYMDFTPLLDFTLNLKPDQLPDWQTYERIRALLRQVRLEFALARR